MTKLMMIMGVQRSGTNALLKCLGSSRRVRAFNESMDNPLFSRLNLRPEPQIRELLQSTRSSVVCKPVNETTVREVSDVFDEFSEHDVWVVWTYRDPVNCYHSHVRRWTGFRGNPTAFAEHWCHRNLSILAALPHHGHRIAVVRYEDLAEDPAVLRDLTAFLATPGCYLFRPDRGIGRERTSRAEQAVIDGATADVLTRLDANRRFVARDARDGLPIWAHRVMGRSRRELFKIRRAVRGTRSR